MVRAWILHVTYHPRPSRTDQPNLTLTSPQTLPDDVVQLLVEQGVASSSPTLLGVAWPDASKVTWRVRLPGGAEAKVRLLRTSEQVQRFLAFRRALGALPGLTDVLHVRGRALLEEWVPGPTLADTEPTDAQLVGSARLLATLHRAPRPANVTPTWSAETELPSLMHALRCLAEAGALTDGERGALAAMLAPLEGAIRTTALMHGDFCGENLVWHETRGVVSIDHEWLEVGPAEFDLGRTLQRWPLAPLARQRFLACYVQAGGPAVLDDVPLWELAAEILSAMIRVRHGRPEAHVPLDALRRRLAGG